jgi:hypothetical protein
MPKLILTFIRACFAAAALTISLAFAVALPSIAAASTSALTSTTSKAAADTFRGNGWWWAGASQSGTGFFFEAQRDSAFVAFFVYDDAGNPTWYSATGTLIAGSGAGFAFSGTLDTCRGGQAAGSNTPAKPTCLPAGNVSINFTGATAASVNLPARSFAAERFNFNGIGSTVTGNQPETGWYWNAAQDGRGYAVEVQNGVIFLAMFHYAPDGRATWDTFSGNVGVSGQFSGSFNSRTGGQTLAGAYRAPSSPTLTPGFAGQFSTACVGSLTFPGNATPSSVNRFGFVLTDTQACATAQGGGSNAGNIFKTEATRVGRDAALRTLNQQGAAGFAFVTGLAVQTNPGASEAVLAFADLYAKGDAGVTYQYVADLVVDDATAFLNRVNSRGAEGYILKSQYAFNPTNILTTDSYYLFVKSTRRATTYSYRLLPQASTSSPSLAEINQQGSAGYVFRVTLIFGTQVVSLYVRDNTSGATYTYETTPMPNSSEAALSEFNAQGARFFIYKGGLVADTGLLNLYERASTNTVVPQYAMTPTNAFEPIADRVNKANDFAGRGLFYWGELAFNGSADIVSLFYKGPPAVLNPFYGVVFP